ncbi:MAG: DUF5686 family protein [Alistipes sp.]|jgi:hypothetical protein|nr:DUF5686 family protein [Alistipes sp.]
MKTLKLFALLVLFAVPGRAQFLGERTYDIESVVVTARGEDRAYRIMRNAIARAPYYRNQVAEYSAEVYLKGSFDVEKISKFMGGLGGSEFRRDVKEGDNYMYESFNEITFTAPDKYEQRVVKQLSNAPGWNEEGGTDTDAGAMRLINFNIYDPEPLGGMVISPLSPGAFTHYKFVYEGYTEFEDRLVNKIRVTPRRRSQQLVEGYLYIAEDFWNVHETDLSGHMNIVAGIDFRLQANYGRVTAGVWMPTNYRITLNLSFMWSRGTMHYVASSKYNSLVEAPSTVAPVASTEVQDKMSNRDAYRLARRMTREIEAPRRSSLDLTEEFADNYKVTADSLSRTPDPAFWDRNRPVELTPAELEGYRTRGIEATEKRDTTSTDHSTPLILKIMTAVDTKPLKLGKKGGEFVWRGLMPSQEGFNTVDGYYLGFKPVAYRKNFSDKANLYVAPEVVWAINRHVALGTLETRLRYAPLRRGEFNLRGGLASRDFNGGGEIGGIGETGGGISRLENTVASLFFRRNYLKLYQENFVEATNRIDLANGLTLSFGAKFARRLGLENTTDYSFFYRNERVYTPNIPIPNHNSMTFAVGVEYTPRQYYRISGGRKVPVRSAWPTVFVDWRKGVSGVWGSVTDFDHIGGGFRQRFSPGQGQAIDYLVRGGVFVNTGSLYFPDFHHFSTVGIPVLNTPIVGGQRFKLLEYYRFGTADRYIQAHVSYQARFLVVKLLPWFSNRLWMEGLQVNYLTTPVLKHYTEFGYTVGLWWQAGVFVGFRGTNYRSWGLKFSIPLRIESDSETMSIALAL